jgi:hypothetical protein
MPFRVAVVESERGWGQRWEYEYFNTIEHADDYVRNMNKDNPPGPAPDWYMQAEEPEFVREIPAGIKARDEGLLL